MVWFELRHLAIKEALSFLTHIIIEQPHLHWPLMDIGILRQRPLVPNRLPDLVDTVLQRTQWFMLTACTVQARA
jgi:hypothetical protein